MKPPNWWQRYLSWRLRHVRRLELDLQGFSVLGSAAAQRVEWNAIRQVTAFKRDLLAVDLLCLAIATDATIVELDEQMTGYPAVEAQLSDRLGLGSEWKLAVLFPAFAANATLLFDADAATRR